MKDRNENWMELQLNVKFEFIIPAYNGVVSLLECVGGIENDIQDQDEVSKVLIIENGAIDNV